jgi:hypothetical protein
VGTHKGERGQENGEARTDKQECVEERREFHDQNHYFHIYKKNVASSLFNALHATQDKLVELSFCYCFLNYLFIFLTNR